MDIYPAPAWNGTPTDLIRLIAIIRLNCPTNEETCPLADGSCETCFAMLQDQVVLNKLAEGAKNRAKYLGEEMQDANG